MTLAFFAPHSWDGHPDQYLPQNETFEVYEHITIKPPYDMEASFKRLPHFFSERNEGRNRYRQRFNTPEKYDTMMKNYFRLITGVDTACKAVWDELDLQGILNETLFIFTTDNGVYNTNVLGFQSKHFLLISILEINVGTDPVVCSSCSIGYYHGEHGLGTYLN